MKKYITQQTVMAQQFDGSDYMIDLWEISDDVDGFYYFWARSEYSETLFEIEVGDWIVCLDDDTIDVVDNEIFTKDYKPVDYVEGD